MKDVIETAAFCAGCAAFAAAILGAVGIITTHVIAPALGFGADNHTIIASFFTRLLG